MRIAVWIFATGAGLVLAGCLEGDSSAVQRFHPKVKPGMPLTEAITEGEKAQKYDIRYLVNNIPNTNAKCAPKQQSPAERQTKM